uniref:Uncharacterized protein n=1 Tax=Oryza glumipatula TaxID=40148 RepID=A0A0D9Y6S3_9ORYZ
MDRVSPPEDGDGRPIAIEGQAVEDLAASALAARGLVTAPGGLGAPADALAVAADGHNANASAVAAARTLLPNAPLLAMEFNLPVLQVQSVGNLGRMLQKLWQQNLTLHGSRLEKKSYGIASQCSSHGQAAAGQPSQSQAAASQPDDRLAAWEHAN